MSEEEKRAEDEYYKKSWEQWQSQHNHFRDPVSFPLMIMIIVGSSSDGLNFP